MTMRVIILLAFLCSMALALPARKDHKEVPKYDEDEEFSDEEFSDEEFSDEEFSDYADEEIAEVDGADAVNDPMQASCKDNYRKCPVWKSWGHCTKAADFMLVNCKLSCGQCKCKDDDSRCAGWASRGECRNNPRYMLKSCKLSCGKCSASSGKKPQTDTPSETNPSKKHPAQAESAKALSEGSKLRAACVDDANRYRALHGAAPAKADEDLMNDAQAWAQNNADRLRMHHSNKQENPQGQGENLAYAAQGGIESWDMLAACKDSNKRWYAEIKDYYPSNPYSSLHYTQMMWKPSMKVGYGFATKEGNGMLYYFVVARYLEKGNMGRTKEYEKYVGGCTSGQRTCYPK